MSDDLIGVPRVLELLEQVVAEYGPDHVAPKFISDPKGGDVESADGYCMYRGPDNKASCIIGQILDKLGMLFEVDPGCDWGGPGVDIHRTRQNFTYEANILLEGAQRCQDAGSPWGEVLESVKRLVTERYI